MARRLNRGKIKGLRLFYEIACRAYRLTAPLYVMEYLDTQEAFQGSRSLRQTRGLSA